MARRAAEQRLPRRLCKQEEQDNVMLPTGTEKTNFSNYFTHKNIKILNKGGRGVVAASAMSTSTRESERASK